MHENGELWMKNGELWMESARCSPLRTERGRRKARENWRRGGRGEGGWVMSTIWCDRTGGMWWANRESPGCGENSCSAVVAQRKN